MEKKSSIFAAVVLALGLSLSGYFIYQGISKYSEKDRCVTVKGLSEREVLANRVTWPMSIELQGNNLDELLTSLSMKKDTVLEFLKENGLNDKELTVSSPNITDRNDFEDRKKYKERYAVTVDITVNSSKVEKVLELKNQEMDLLKKGVRISSEEYRTEYDYVGLSDLKPEMVEEATKGARAVALKFAEDAGCELGSIRDATQGQFSIDAEYYRPQYKQIRVVTTISYYLK